MSGKYRKEVIQKKLAKVLQKGCSEKELDKPLTKDVVKMPQKSEEFSKIR